VLSEGAATPGRNGRNGKLSELHSTALQRSAGLE
jgi:hypothetical protein